METDIYIGFSPALHFQCRNIFENILKRSKNFYLKQNSNGALKIYDFSCLFNFLRDLLWAVDQIKVRVTRYKTNKLFFLFVLDDHFQTVRGKTISTDDFYEGQVRITFLVQPVLLLC